MRELEAAELERVDDRRSSPRARETLAATVDAESRCSAPTRRLEVATSSAPGSRRRRGARPGRIAARPSSSRRLSPSGPARAHRPAGVRRRRRSPPTTLAEVFRLVAAGDPNVAPDPAQPLRLRQRAARAGHRAPSRSGSSARCWPVRGSATRSRRSAPSTSATSARRSTARPGRPDRPRRSGVLDGDQGLLHRRALRRLDPGARATSTSTARCTSPGSSATLPASTVIDDWDGVGQRTTGERHGAARPSVAGAVGPDHAVPPHLRAAADVRRVRPAAARGDRRRHRPARRSTRPPSS